MVRSARYDTGGFDVLTRLILRGPVRPERRRRSSGALATRLRATLPEWWEAVAEKEIAYIWRCIGCDSEFETRDKVVAQGPTSIELVEELLPNLIVA